MRKKYPYKVQLHISLLWLEFPDLLGRVIPHRQNLPNWDKDCEIQFHGYPQKKYMSIEVPDISALSATELRFIDETMARLGSMNASQIGEYSHQMFPGK